MMSDPYRELRGMSYSGVKSSEPQQVGKVISELIALKGLARVQGIEQLQQAWRSVAGEATAKNSRAVELSRGVLVVGVNSSALLNELAGFHKHDLLAKLQAEFSHLKIRDLKFRLKTNKK